MEGAPPRTKGPCYKCGKMGHFARDCRSSRANYARWRNQNYMDEPEDLSHIQTPIDPANGLENALNAFDALSLEQKNEMIDRYEGKTEDFPAA